MAGRAETFHEGSGEGDGRLNGKVLTATINDGAGGSCRLTMTFNLGRMVVKAFPNCRINVNPEGNYKKEMPAQRSPEPKGLSQKPQGLAVCPDPNAPCRSAMV